MADGIIIMDKPAGWTSMDVCAKLRGILKTKKVGHAGTLDPMATGVLPSRDSDIYATFTAAMIDPLPEQQREFLAVMGLADEFTVEMACFVTGDADAKQILSALTEQNAFIKCLEDGVTYRFHHMMKECAERAFAALDGEKQTVYHTRFGEWYEARRRYLHAMTFYRRSGDYDALLRVVQEDAGILLASVAPAAVLKTLAQCPVSVTREMLEAVLPRFTGEIQQIPPMYSAIKINGQKLYELARKGTEIQRSARNITIFDLELLGKSDDGDWRLRVRCSKGTYVRTLCHDIGQALGCGGCMSSLRRTMAAGFTLAESHTLEEVQQRGESLLAPTDSLFRQYPAHRLTTEKADRACRCGNPIPAEGLAEGLYRVYGLNGQFLCLSSWKNGLLISQKNFFGA